MQWEWTNNALGGAHEADLHQLLMLLEHLVKVHSGHPPWICHSADFEVGFVRARSAEELVLQNPGVNVSRDSLKAEQARSCTAVRPTFARIKLISPAEPLRK